MNAKPPPGSDKAVKLGCHCPVLDNEHGRGYMGMPGVYVTQGNCPLHGEKKQRKIRRKK